MKALSQLKALKELNMIMKTNASVYSIRDEEVFMSSNYEAVERIGYLNDPDSLSELNDLLIGVPHATTFCTKYTKTHTECNLTDSGIEFVDPHKEVSLDLKRCKLTPDTIRPFYTKLFNDQQFTDSFFIDIRDESEYRRLSDLEINFLENKESIALDGSIYISRIVADPKKMDRIEYKYANHLSNLCDDKNYLIIKSSNDVITIYTIVAYVL